MRIPFLLLIALAVTPLAARAEEKEPPLLMQEVRQPSAGTQAFVITREQIERSQTPFVLDLLRTVPGLHIIQAGAPGKIAVVFARGSQPEQVLVMLDGERLNGGLLPIDLAHLMTTNVERIEIELGPHSAIDGSSAAGAVIRIITRYSGPIVSARGEYGSNSTGRFSVRSGAGSDANHYAIAFERYDTDGEAASSDYRNDTLSARAKVMITQWTSLAAQYHDTDTEGGPASSNLLSRRSTRTRLLSIPIQQELARWASLEARYSVLQEDVNRASSRTDTFRISGHIRPAQAHDLVAGYEHEDQKTTLSKFGTEQEITNDAGFAEYRWTPSPALQASLGVRVDDDSINGSRFSPRITASYRFCDGLRIRGSAGTGYRRPAPEEVRFILVKRETVDGMDLGAEITKWKRLTASATFFRTRYSDTIFNLNFFGPRNLPAYTVTGVELQATVHAAEGLDIGGTYTLSHAPDLSLAPENSGSIQANYAYRRLQWIFNWYLIGDSLITEAHTRADTAISFNIWKGLQAYGRATNLFDSKYVEFFGYPAEGRAAYFGLRWN